MLLKRVVEGQVEQCWDPGTLMDSDVGKLRDLQNIKGCVVRQRYIYILLPWSTEKAFGRFLLLLLSDAYFTRLFAVRNVRSGMRGTWMRGDVLPLFFLILLIGGELVRFIGEEQ